MKQKYYLRRTKEYELCGNLYCEEFIICNPNDNEQFIIVTNDKTFDTYKNRSVSISGMDIFELCYTLKDLEFTYFYLEEREKCTLTEYTKQLTKNDELIRITPLKELRTEALNLEREQKYVVENVLGRKYIYEDWD